MKKTKDLFQFSLGGLIRGDDLLAEFKEHYLESRIFVRKILYYHTSFQDLDDLVQEIYLKAWKSYPSFKRESSFQTWIYTIAMNTVKDLYRKNTRLDLSDEELNTKHYDFERYNSESDSTENNYRDKELIEKGLLLLSEERKEVFILFYYLSYTFEEIARFTGSPVGTVKSQVYRGKEIFLNYLKKNGVSYG